jgi:hypothetical protein
LANQSFPHLGHARHLLIEESAIVVLPPGFVERSRDTASVEEETGCPRIVEQAGVKAN